MSRDEENESIFPGENDHIGNDDIDLSGKDSGKDASEKDDSKGKGGEKPQDGDVLDRRFGAIESTLASLAETLTTIATNQSKMFSRKESGDDERDLKDTDFATTVGDVKKVLKVVQTTEARAREEADRTYATSYLSTIRGKGASAEDKGLHDATYKELTENYKEYMRFTSKDGSDDPVRDAGINYRLAQARVLVRRAEKAEEDLTPSVRGKEGDKSRAGISTSSRQGGTPGKSIVFDEYAQKFIKGMGAKEGDDWVREAVSKVK